MVKRRCATRRGTAKQGPAKIAWLLLVAGLAVFLLPVRLSAQATGILGDWMEPAGSVIHIGPCGAHLCMWIVYLSKNAPATTDILNPNPALRGRSLCGLKIGSGFLPHGPARATGGTLYDPKTGKTYSGTMTRDGTRLEPRLELRGYIGIPLFGRSQTWTHAPQLTKPCKAGPGGG